MPHPAVLHAKKTLARNIKKLRAERGLAQERLGFDAEVDRTLVSKIEREIANPTLDVLVKISVCLQVPLNGLFDGVEADGEPLGGGGLQANPINARKRCVAAECRTPPARVAF